MIDSVIGLTYIHHKKEDISHISVIKNRTWAKQEVKKEYM